MHTEHNGAPNSDVNPEAIKLGYEPDKAKIRTILYVPVAIVITFVITYFVVTLIIDSLREGPKPKPGSSLAADRNEAVLNARLNRISSTDPKAEVHQPRLEGLDELTTKQPPYVQSSAPTKVGNSRRFHPEDLRTTSEYAKQLGLQSYSWKNESDKTVRIPITEAIKILSAWENEKNTDKLKKFGFGYEDKVNLQALSASQPTPSNPQRGVKPADEKAAPEAKSAPESKPKGGEH